MPIFLLKLWHLKLLLVLKLLNNICIAFYYIVAEVPKEILFKGQRTMLMYQKTLRDGFVNVYRGRIFLIGQDRAGKTSLKSHCWVCHLTQKKKALKELTLQSVILMLIEFKTGISTAKIRFCLKFLSKFQGRWPWNSFLLKPLSKFQGR